VLIPDENQKDLVEIPDNIKGNLEIKPVKWIDEVLTLALTQQPGIGAVEPPAPAAAPAEDKRPGRRNGRRTIKQPVPAH
jgi:ATP-dependent Lon protease